MTELRRQRLQTEIDANNSQYGPGDLLGIGGVFTGTGSDLTLGDYAMIHVAIFSDVDSATDGLEIQFSADDVTWFTTDEYTYTGGLGLKIFEIPRILRYFRVKYTNGGVGQASFILETTLLTGVARGSSHRLEENLSGQDDAELVKAVVAAKIPNGMYANLGATAGGALKVNITDENQDAFGRVRVSNPVSLIDSTFGYNLNPRQFEDISSGNGAVAYDAVEKAADFSITAGAPGVAGLQSYQYAHYNPGKSHLIFMTASTDPLGNLPFVAGQKYEVGYFDDDNGIFARVDDTGAHAVLRSSTSGGIVETVVDQADFNIDVMDGSGNPDNPSGIAINPGASQILVIDLQFLGVGRVRVGLDISGKVFFAHEFQFANIVTGLYMQTATLPVRWLLTDTGTTGWDKSQGYCSMVTTEGGQEEDRGIPLTVGTAVTTAIPAGADTHLISIRPGLLFNGLVNRIWNILESVRVLNTGNNEVIVKVWYDAALATPAFAAVDASDSSMEFDVAGTHTPGTGIQIAEFYAAATNQAKDTGAFAVKSRLPIALDRAGTGRIGVISVTAQAIGLASAAWATIAWREVR